ncbi:hypothetical protein BHUM_06130c [Candidatus Burkholderia humilis]|nr:hypothetical protein BHUM_06130c [Candidatus Burkholderia humilis]
MLKKTNKNAAASTTRNRAAKAYWLPIPKRDAQTIILQYRLALETIRRDKASQVEAQCIAQAVLLTRLLSETGHGKLDAEILRDTEEDVLAMLDLGARSGIWRYPATGIARLTQVVNEHDRQLHEVNLSALIACNERLRGFIETAAKA